MPGEGDDSIFILSDHVSHGEFAGRHHSGNLADVVFDVDYNDRITILGCATEELNVIALDDGYGIKAKGCWKLFFSTLSLIKQESQE